MCVLSSVQCVQLHCFSRPKSDRQSRLAPARPFTHAHIPPSTHVFTHTTAHADTDTAYTDNHALTQKKKTHTQTHTHSAHQLAATQRCKTGSVPAISKDDPLEEGHGGWGAEKQPVTCMAGYAQISCRVSALAIAMKSCSSGAGTVRESKVIN